MGKSLRDNGIYEFGAFRLDAVERLLQRAGEPVLITPKALEVLVVLLKRAGHVVRKEELMREVWPGTFVEPNNLAFNISLLRKALGDSAENARYIETVPGLGYRFVGPIADTAAQSCEEPAQAPQAPNRRHLGFWWWLVGAAACALSFVLGWRIHHSPGDPGAWQLSQVTSDPGLSYTPAISRDGTLIAYSSDRNAPGQLDLYVKQVTGDHSLRLTFDGLGNVTPDFSPDGSKIVFRSNRDGGGIYELPTLGGETRLIVKQGRNPKYSPDGSKIAYWIGGPSISSAVPGSGTVWVAPLAGGQPWRVGASFSGARYPIWSVDGQRLLMVGYRSSHAYEAKSLDWWLVSIDGKRAVQTGIYAPLVRAGIQNPNMLAADPSSLSRARDMTNPACWSRAGTVIFSAQSGYTRNVWQTYISPETGKANGKFKRLTVGAANEWEPSCGGEDRIVFTSLQIRRNVWSVPFALDAGKIKGPLEQVTKTMGWEEHAALSRDGAYVAFASPEAGIHNILLREIATGKELRVAESPLHQAFPVISAFGSKIAYSVYSAGGARSIYIGSPGRTPEAVCREGCLRATDWANDERSLLVFGGNPYRVSALDIASRKQTVLLKHDRYSLLYARYSPDNRWVSFTARVQADRSKIMLAPIRGECPVPESQWIQIADTGPEDWANWSPDGRTLYYTSARDGHFCFWGQRIDPVSRQPIGEAFPALHLHGNPSYLQGGWSAAGDRIAMVLTADSGNVWLLSRPASSASP